MLIEFIQANRQELILRTRAKVAMRMAPKPTEEELESGVPLFLEQLVETLKFASATISQTMNVTAAARGAVMLSRGYTVGQVVHDYGDICQAITALADETDAPITTDEFHTLNECLDNAIAEAVSEYERLNKRTTTASETERTGVFAHELRNRISAAQLAFMAIKSGRAPIGGSVAAIVTRNLHAMTALINRTLVEVRLESGHTQAVRVQLRELIEAAEVEGTIEASAHGVSLSVAPTDPAIVVLADPEILAGAVANLLQNAFKFTHNGGRVTLHALVKEDHVEIAIEDECGGLPPGKAEELFGAFQQRATNRRGLGLGLFISRKGVEASGGQIRLRDLPGKGCVFTIDLPLVPRAVSLPD